MAGVRVPSWMSLSLFLSLSLSPPLFPFSLCHFRCLSSCFASYREAYASRLDPFSLSLSSVVATRSTCCPSNGRKLTPIGRSFTRRIFSLERALTLNMAIVDHPQGGFNWDDSGERRFSWRYLDILSRSRLSYGFNVDWVWSLISLSARISSINSMDFHIASLRFLSLTLFLSFFRKFFVLVIHS